MLAQKIFLPDLEANWHWPRRVNPHTESIKPECQEWVSAFEAFTPEAQKAFDKCNFSNSAPQITKPTPTLTRNQDILTGLSYPWLNREQLRCASDLMNLFFIFDEHSDKCAAAEVWDQVDVIMDAMRNPDKTRPVGEWIGGEVARQ